MTRTISAAVGCLVALCGAPRMFADELPPNKLKPTSTTVKCVAVRDHGGEKLKIVLPSKLKTGEPAGKTGLWDSGRTVIAGLALSGSALATILVLRRRTKPAGWATIVGLALVLSGGSLLWANIGPPPRPPLVTAEIEVIFDDDATEARLQVPAKVLEELQKPAIPR